MKIEWQEIPLPDFGVSEETPSIPSQIYENRCCQAYNTAKCDWLVVYGDREHYANIVYLTGFDPRFEEALLVLGSDQRRILIVGNEGKGYVSQAGLFLDVALCQTFSLMGQDRSSSPTLSVILANAGIHKGQRVGLVGWKYLEQNEWTGKLPGFFAPAMLVDILRELTGEPEAVMDATGVLMHPARGLRTVNEVEQIAAFEWSASRATQAVMNILRGTHPGLREYQAVSLMHFAGEPLSCHVMFASGKKDIIGLRSPTTRYIESGDGVTTAVGYWGGLCCRAGLMASEHSEFLNRIAIPYFYGLVTWYKTLRIGIEGGGIYEKVTEALSQGGLRSMLNPGHITSFDEWLHSPIRQGSLDRIISGMAFQSDIIPTPMPPGYSMNCEDPIIFADENLRQEIRLKYPNLWSRVIARQTFMRDVLGIEISDEVLPLSMIPGYLPPLWLSPLKVLVIR